MPTQVSVVVRARDEAPTIGRCLELVAAQQLDGPPPELIVVDSGSRDGTPEIARRHGAEVVSLLPESFSFGGALNRGAAQATGDVVVAVSADAFLSDPQWLSRATAWFDDSRVACASGDRYDPQGRRLAEPIEQGIELAGEHPEWGYSNSAGAFRAELWRQRPFREDLPGCEDKEWAWHWLSAGYRCVVDPGLAAEHDHTHDSLPRIYRRARRESEGLALFLDGVPNTAPGLLQDWWEDTHYYPSPLRARLSHRRAARLVGERAGRRRARRRLAGH